MTRKGTHVDKINLHFCNQHGPSCFYDSCRFKMTVIVIFYDDNRLITNKNNVLHTLENYSKIYYIQGD